MKTRSLPLNMPAYLSACLIFLLTIPGASSQPSEQVLTEMGGKRISVPAGDIAIDSWWFDLGPDTGKLKPALIHIHGWNEDGVYAGRFAAIYARYFSEQRNYVGLAVTLRGWPDTGGVNDCGLQQPKDISRVVDWLAAQPGIDPERIGIVGNSQGGQVALLTAALNPKVKTVVGLGPLTDVTTWYESFLKAYPGNEDQFGGLTEEWIDNYVNVTCASPGSKGARSPLFMADKIQARVLTLHGEADVIVPVSQSRAMHAALLAHGKDSTLITKEGAPHSIAAPGWDEIAELERIMDWLDANL